MTADLIFAALIVGLLLMWFLVQVLLPAWKLSEQRSFKQAVEGVVVQITPDSRVESFHYLQDGTSRTGGTTKLIWRCRAHNSTKESRQSGRVYRLKNVVSACQRGAR